MITNLAAAAANCNTGTWMQQFKCGYNQPTSPHVISLAHAVGFGLIPALLALGLLVFVARSVKGWGKSMKRKTGRSTATAGARR